MSAPYFSMSSHIAGRCLSDRSKTSSFLCLLRYFSHHPARHPAGEDIGGDIPGHDAAGADHGVIPDRDAGAEDRARGDPDVAANRDRRDMKRFVKCFFVFIDIFIILEYDLYNKSYFRGE